jgi:hypothetical protein
VEKLKKTPSVKLQEYDSYDDIYIYQSIFGTPDGMAGK